jgi:phosphoglycolate phosphatase
MTLLFDLDGTLTDSGPGIMNCAQLALDHFGLRPDRREDLRRFVGPPLREMFPQFGVPEDKVEEAVAVFRGRYERVGKFENTPYPGIREALEALQSQGHRLYVATSKPENTAVEILHKFELSQYFQKICGADLSGARDNKDAVIAYLLSQLESPGRLLMIGDTIYDIQGARIHNIPTLAVTWGYEDPAALRAANPLALVDRPEDLPDAVQAAEKL